TSNQILEVRVSAIPLRVGRHGAGVGNALPAAKTFVVSKEENLVLDDRPTEGDSVLILPQFALLAALEVIGGIQLVVAEELPGTSMELVRPRLDGGVQHSSTRPAELSTEIRGLYFEFLNR